MSDPQATAETTSLPEQILSVPEPIWRKISASLRVKTRQEAVQLVQADEQAASMVSQIINTWARSKSALTQEPGAQQRSALTSSPASVPASERLYGGGGKARLKIG